MDLKALEAERQAIERDADALGARIEDLKQRAPLLTGAAVAAVRSEELQSIERDAASLAGRRDALSQRVRQYRLENERGLVGWTARRGRFVGAAVATAGWAWAILCWTYSASRWTEVDGEFFAAAAQIMPVLIVAFAIEVRAFRVGWLRFLQGFNFVLISAVFMGEIAALIVLGGKQPSSLLFGFTAAALISLAGLLAAVALIGERGSV